ncbi:hypothetical protein H3C66_02225 [Patescibacteria group bacterium]|nr:hypothetical protein [Patescibacteria group bacterium]
MKEVRVQATQLPFTFVPLRWLAMSAVCLALFAVATESYRSPTTFFDLTGFSSEAMVFLAVGLFFYCRAQFSPVLPRKMSRLLKKIILPVVLFITVSFSIIAALLEPNQLYSYTLINYQKVGVLAFGLSYIVLLDQSSERLTNHRQRIILWSAPLLFVFFLLMSLWPFDYLKEVVKEDNAVEWLQCIALIVSSIYAFLVGWTYRKKKQWILALLYFFVVFILIVIAADEISWGQRLLQVEAPATFKDGNLQGETNLHNFSLLHHLVGIGYICISGYALSSQFIIDYLTKKTTTKKAIVILSVLRVPWWLGGYFILPLIYNLIGLFFVAHPYSTWAEVTELFLYTGLFLIFFEKYLRQQQGEDSV